jgi:mannose/fructose/N-acetylgalactosamine-specific phosphotransferase system component IID
MDQEALLPFDTPSNANNANNQNSAYKVNYNRNTLTFNGYLDYRYHAFYSVILLLLVTGLVLLFIFKKENPWALVLIVFIFGIFFFCAVLFMEHLLRKWN